MKTNLLYLLAVLLFLSGCASSETEPAPAQTYLLQRKLSQITFADGGRLVIDLTYSYNDLDQLVRIGGVTVRDSVKAYNITLDYDSQGRLLHVQNSPQQYFDYFYNDQSQLVKQVSVSNDPDGTTSYYYYLYTYNAENQLVEAQVSRQEGGVDTFVGTVNYAYAAANKVDITYQLSSGEIYRDCSIITDDQKLPSPPLPLRHVPVFFDSEVTGEGLFTTHNTLSETILQGEDKRMYGGSYTATYDYNTAGYPVSSVKIFEGGGVEHITYVYATR